MTNIVKKENSAPAFEYTKEQYELAKRTYCEGATDDEFNLFCYIAKKRGLDILSGQIYSIAFRSGKRATYASIDGMRAIAHQTGECIGISDARFVNQKDPKTGREIDVPYSATVTVKRIVGGKHVAEFTHTAYMSDRGYTHNKKAMLAKTAERGALRKGFPELLGQIYGEEELPPEMEESAAKDQSYIDVEKEARAWKEDAVEAINLYLSGLTKGLSPDEKMAYATEVLGIKTLGELKNMVNWERDKLEKAIELLRSKNGS